MGLDNAADNLDHFLEGSGQDRIIPRDEARKRDPVIEGERKNQKRFLSGFTEDHLSGQNPDSRFEYRSHLLAMQDGQTLQLPAGPAEATKPRDFYDSNRTTRENLKLWEVDEALASGSSTFSSKAQNGFVATRRGDRIVLEGTVTHEWNDPYDFHGPTDKTSGGPLPEAARDFGDAREYKNLSTWD